MAPDPRAARGPLASRGIFTIVGVAAALRLALAPLRRLSFDEAYYLCAARSTARIPDHPPVLLWLLRAVDHVPVAIEIRVRVIAIVGQALCALGVARLAKNLGGARAGVLAAALATWGLMPWAGGLIATPDAPLLAACAWIFALATEEKPRLIPLALLSAVALASKVSAALVLAAVALSLPFRIAPALFVGAAIAAPLTIQSAILQAHHALGSGPLVFAPRVGVVAALSGLVLGGFVLWSPPVFALVASRRAGATLRRIPGAVPTLAVTLALLVVSAVISGRVPEPNWLAPAMLPVFAVAAVHLAETRHTRLVLGLHAAPALVAIALWVAPDLLAPSIDPLARAPHDVRRLPDAPRPPYAEPAWACVYR